jgi:hypothetical protein
MFLISAQNEAVAWKTVGRDGFENDPSGSRLHLLYGYGSVSPHKCYTCCMDMGLIHAVPENCRSHAVCLGKVVLGDIVEYNSACFVIVRA